MSVQQKSHMLNGIRIADLTSVVFGPYATQCLADYGADVIKIEPPEGDIFRTKGAKVSAPGMGAVHMNLNRNKRSAVMDLKSDEGRENVLRLIATSDVFVHNVRENAIKKLGLDYDAVRQVKPDIIYVHCVGFGSDGPYAGLQAYDDIIQALSGVTSFLPRVDGDQQPRFIPSLIADKVAGLYAAQAIQTALIHKLRTGQGQRVEVPMFESFVQFAMLEHLCGKTWLDESMPSGYLRQFLPNRQPMSTLDGFVSVVPYTDATWVQFFDLAGRPEITEREDLCTPELRAANVTRLYTEMSLILRERTTADWVALFNPASIPAMPVNGMDDLVDDPHLRAVGFFQEREHASAGRYLEMRAPLRFSACAPESHWVKPAPELGEHTEGVLAELAGMR